MDRAISAPEEYVQADLEFHSILAAATGNPLFGALVNPVIDMLHDARLFIFEAPGAPQRGQEGHRSLLRCIEEKDAHGAREEMHRHLVRADEDLKMGMALADERARRSRG
jgi:GntR family transcriptional repressor for pyruvate dehydrogenase complex